MRLIALLLCLFAGEALAQSCTTTLSAGNSISSAISSAAGGDTICLNDGTYAGMTLNNVSKNPAVTVRAVNSKQATLTSGLTMSGSTSKIIFDGVNMPGANIYGAVSDLTLKNFNATGQIRIGIVTVTNPNLLIESVSQVDLDVADADPAGIFIDHYNTSRTTPVVTIRYAYIDGGCADGIRADVPFILEYSQIKNKVVGSCPGDPHVDALQFYGWDPSLFAGTIIRGNYWYGNVQVIAAYDGVAGVLIEDNVLDPGASGERRECQIELYSDDGSIVRHNTVLNRGSNLGGICFDAKTGDDDGVDSVLINNIAAYVSVNRTTFAQRTNNLLAAGAGAGEISGSPTFVGGTYPSTWAGFDLTAESLGVGDATDESNIGSHYFGTTTIRPEPPTNVVVTDNSDHLGWFAANWVN